MKRKSITATLSPITNKTKSTTTLEEQMNYFIKHLCFAFAFCVLFGACSAYSQNSEYKLEIKRSFPASERPEGPDRHGDYSYFKVLENGGTVGSLHLFKPREAIFIIWDGEVIAGPLTTVKQVEEAYEMLSNESASEHELQMDIMKKFPTGQKKKYRVYDSKGKLIREEDEP